MKIIEPLQTASNSPSKILGNMVNKTIANKIRQSSPPPLLVKCNKVRVHVHRLSIENSFEKNK